MSILLQQFQMQFILLMIIMVLYLDDRGPSERDPNEAKKCRDQVIFMTVDRLSVNQWRQMGFSIVLNSYFNRVLFDHLLEEYSAQVILEFVKFYLSHHVFFNRGKQIF